MGSDNLAAKWRADKRRCWQVVVCRVVFLKKKKNQGTWEEMKVGIAPEKYKLVVLIPTFHICHLASWNCTPQKMPTVHVTLTKGIFPVLYFSPLLRHSSVLPETLCGLRTQVYILPRHNLVVKLQNGFSPFWGPKPTVQIIFNHFLNNPNMLICPTLIYQE